MNLLDLGYFFFLLITFPLWIKFIFNKRFRSMLRNRLSPEMAPSRKKTIWLHAVSVGEVKSLENLIGHLEPRPHPVVLSVTTASGYRYARKALTGIQVIASPLDFSFVIKRFLKTINPCILVLNELEIWPNWLSVTGKQGVPVLLINGRMSPAAFKKYRKFRLVLKRIFNRIDYYILQSDIHKQRFLFFGLPESKLEVCGNIKADEALALVKTLPPEKKILKYLNISKPGKKLVVCASTHSSDEAVIIPALSSLGKKYAFIMVPRHPERLPRLRQQLQQNGIPYSVWSDSERTDLDERLLIFDRIGYLFNILSISDLVVMGGTFDKKIGGHNLYEPAVLGKPILGGPHTQNFPVIGRDLVDSGAYLQIRDRDDLSRALDRLLDMDIGPLKKRAVQTVRNKEGSTECILNHIHGFINH